MQVDEQAATSREDEGGDKMMEEEAKIEQESEQIIISQDT